jgi:FHS family glucose/mannose:H+ symporter-like MFS transporter
MKHWRIKLSVYINYFVFAILLNSVGILIQRSINAYGVDELAASSLEAFKDLSIAATSFLIGTILPRLGYRAGLMMALVVVFGGCLSMYFGNSFPHVQALFLCTGISFAIAKVSVYALIGAVTDTKKELNALMSSVESVFMVGIAAAYIIFPFFYSDTDPDAWLRIYLLLAVLIGLTFILVGSTRFTEVAAPVRTSLKKDFLGMIRMMKLPMILVFALSAFMYVMTEQGVMSWLPTFNERVLHLPENVSVNMSIILALSIALGRYVAGQLVKKVVWIKILVFSLVAAALLVLFVLPLTGGVEPRDITSLADIPLVAFVFPLIGLFLAPIYPLMNSVVMGATEKPQHSALAGLLTFFSAIGGTLGSFVVGHLFREIGGDQAFYFSLIPIGCMVILLIVLYRLVKAQKDVRPSGDEVS